MLYIIQRQTKYKMSLSFGQAIMGGLLFILLIKIYKYTNNNTYEVDRGADEVDRGSSEVDRRRYDNIRIKYNQEKQWRTEALGENCDMDILTLFMR